MYIITLMSTCMYMYMYIYPKGCFKTFENPGCGETRTKTTTMDKCELVIRFRQSSIPSRVAPAWDFLTKLFKLMRNNSATDSLGKNTVPWHHISDLLGYFWCMISLILNMWFGRDELGQIDPSIFTHLNLGISKVPVNLFRGFIAQGQFHRSQENIRKGTHFSIQLTFEVCHLSPVGGPNACFMGLSPSGKPFQRRLLR